MNLFRNVLASVDLGDPESSSRVLNAALEIIESGDRLNVVSVVPDFGVGVVGSFFPDNYEKQALEKATDALHAFTDKHVPKGTKVKHIVGHGNVYEEILDAANKVSADIIVIGSDRPKLQDYLLGPNAARVVRHAPQSVLVVRSKD